MTLYSWPDQDEFDANRLTQGWAAAISVLPIGAKVSGEVIARQPFGVFVRIDGVPFALGLAEITSMPHDVALPDVGAMVTGEVIWHAEHNHQIKLRLRVPNRMITETCRVWTAA